MFVVNRKMLDDGYQMLGMQESMLGVQLATRQRATRNALTPQHLNSLTP